MEKPPIILCSLTAPSLPSDTLLAKQEELIREINEEFGPIATPSYSKEDSTAKGEGLIILGQIALAAISAGLIKHFATVIVEFLKRNERFTFQLGDLMITKDHASADDISKLASVILKLQKRL